MTAPARSFPAGQRASELVVRVSCVSESYSVGALLATRTAARHPLLRAAHDLLLRDETHHARFGWWFLDWIGDSLDAPERARLAAVAADQMSLIASATAGETGPGDSRGLLAEQVISSLRRYGIESVTT